MSTSATTSERKESMQQHQQQQQVVLTSSSSKQAQESSSSSTTTAVAAAASTAEAAEWQKIATKEKKHVDYAQTSHFSKQNTAAPSFIRSLEPVTATEGETAKLMVEFNGEPVPAVKWFRYSFQVQNSDDFQIRTTDTSSCLIIKKTCTDDSGIFTCLIENIVGSCKTSTNLNVVESGEDMYTMEASVVKTTLKEMNVNEGDNIRFDIQFTAGDKSNLKFTHNDKPIDDVTGNDVKISVENDVATLLIANANPNHSGLYTCHMKTDAGEATCSVKCNVIPTKAA